MNQPKYTLRKGQSNQETLWGLLTNVTLFDPDLTLRQVRILMCLHDSGGSGEFSNTELSKRCFVPTPQIRSDMKKLFEKGYIYYYYGSRRKSGRGSLTNKGRNLCRDIFKPQEI